MGCWAEYSVWWVAGLNIQYDRLLGWIFSMMYCWEKLYYVVWNGECIWQPFCIFCLMKAFYFQAPLYLVWLSFHTVSEHMGAVVCLCFIWDCFHLFRLTELISRVITGAIKCKNSARMLWFPNLCLSCHSYGATVKDHENLRTVSLGTRI